MRGHVEIPNLWKSSSGFSLPHKLFWIGTTTNILIDEGEILETGTKLPKCSSFFQISTVIENSCQQHLQNKEKMQGQIYTGSHISRGFCQENFVLSIYYVSITWVACLLVFEFVLLYFFFNFSFFISLFKLNFRANMRLERAMRAMPSVFYFGLHNTDYS